MQPMEPEFFNSGRGIFQEGEPGHKMYVVKDGVVELCVHGKLVLTVRKGGIIGEMALIDNKPRSASARAKTDCELLPIDNARFISLVRQKPSFAIEVMKVLAERLRIMDEMA